MEKEVIARLKRATPAAFAGTPVLFAYLYGSQATGRARPDSDVDVAVYLAPEAVPEKYLDLRLELARHLEDRSGVRGVEITVLNEVPLSLRGRVLQEGIVVYSRDEPLRVRYCSRTMREFLDFQIHALPLDLKLLRDTAEGRR